MIFRAVRTDDNLPVVIKALKATSPSAEEIIRFTAEFDMTKRLYGEGIIKPLSIEKHHHNNIMVFEDIGGDSLDNQSMIFQNDLILPVRLIKKVALCLQTIHKRKAIHKNINPGNIVWNPESNELKLIDFGLATFFSDPSFYHHLSDNIEGTMAYLAPEQTGRISLECDHRADLYSLGIMSYEMLTGELPFQCNDSLGYIHAHIAETPASLTDKNSRIPKVLSDIVLKLINKAPENRYQSTAGLIYDISLCLNSLEKKKPIPFFKTALKDISPMLMIPDVIEGRKQETSTILDLFQKVKNGSNEIVLVSGDEGAGKTSFLQAMKAQLSGHKAKCISGKSDPMDTGTPYKPIIDAFKGLFKTILQGHANTIRLFKELILSEMGDNAAVVSSIFPDLEIIIGKQSAMSDSSPLARKNRLNFYMQKFVSIWTMEKTPLVIFIDDLQWCDPSSLDLLAYILTDPFTVKVLFIGTYRTNEIGDHHPLRLFIRHCREKGASATDIKLKNLSQKNIAALLAKTFSCSENLVNDISDVITRKTGGNPFYVKQLLRYLYENKIISLSTKTNNWQWKSKDILNAQLTGNISHLFKSKFDKLDKNEMAVLELASFSGRSFSFEFIGRHSDLSNPDIASALQKLIEENLVFAPDNAQRLLETLSIRGSINISIEIARSLNFIFVHDKIRDEVYYRIPQPDRIKRHLTIGQSLLKDNDNRNHLTATFHLNLAESRIDDLYDRYKLAEQNLKAGKHALTSSAWKTAHHYFTKGVGLLDEQAWEECYSLTLELHSSLCESAYINGLFDQVYTVYETLSAKTKDILHIADAAKFKIRSYMDQNKPKDAVNFALTLLTLLGISIPKNNLKLHAVILFFKTRRRLNNKKLLDLEKLPAVNDPYKKAAMEIMGVVSRAAYLSSPELAVIIGFNNIFLTLDYGICPASSAGFIFYAIILCGAIGDINRGYLYGNLALKIVERFDDELSRPIVTFLFNLFIRHWKEPLAKTLSPLKRSYYQGIEKGTSTDAANAGQVYCSYLFLAGVPLDRVYKEMQQFDKRIESLNQKPFLFQLRIMYQLTEHLISKEKNGGKCFSGAVYDEKKMVIAHEKASDKTTLFLLYLAKMKYHYIFRNYEKALQNAEKARKYIKSATGIAAAAEFYSLDSLIRTAVYSRLPWRKRIQSLILIRRNQKKISRWVSVYPDNHLTNFLLVKAELALLKKKYDQASILYKKAIHHGEKNQHHYFESLPNELYGRFWIQKNEIETGLLYLQKAVELYKIWGAEAKISELIEEFPALIKKNPGSISSDKNHTALDYKSIMKTSQALSEDIDIEKSLKRIMRILAENAGANKGYLVLYPPGANAQVLFIEAIFDSGNNMADSVLPIPVDNSPDVPAGIIHYVERTCEILLLNDAGRSELFAGDPYIQKHHSKSVLCIPVKFQNKLSGVLFLENSLTHDVFTPDRVEVLTLLASQAAVSINNARLYTKYRSLYDNAVEGMFQTTLKGDIISINPSMAGLLGYSSINDFDNAIINIQELFVSSDDMKTLLRVLREKNRIFSYDAKFRKKSGESLWVSISVRAVININRESSHFEGSLVDISERVEKEKAFRDRNAAEAANRIKSQFLAVMSHEVRTPINAIIGLAGLVNSDTLSPRQQENIDLIKDSAQSLLSLVNDILDISRIEAGKLQLEITEFNLHDKIRQIAALFKEQAEVKDIIIRLAICPDVPEYVAGDPTRFGQILINLISNAIKFTDTGFIDITVSLLFSDDTDLTLQCSVKDTGIGIKQEMAEQLFQPFTQEDLSTTRKYGGTGLGLAICRQLVDLMHGSIYINPAYSQGAEFFFNVVMGKTIPGELTDNKTSAVFISGTNPESKSLERIEDKQLVCKLKKFRQSLSQYDPVATEQKLELIQKQYPDFVRGKTFTKIKYYIDRLEFDTCYSFIGSILGKEDETNHEKKTRSDC